MDQMTFYSAALEGVLPDTARFPWESVSAVAGSGIVDGGVKITASGATVRYFRRRTTTPTPLPAARLEIQLRFAGSTSTPGWGSGVSGHALFIDDGVRQLGVSIGDTLTAINPQDGSILWELPAGMQPGGWLAQRSYHLVKDGTAWWELYVDGRLVFRLPYLIGDVSDIGVPTWGWGWFDAVGSGIGTWDLVETSVDAPLAPAWMVDRAQIAAPAPLQAEWNARTEALFRALIGLEHTTRDRMERLRRNFTAALVPIEEGTFQGDVDPTTLGWTAQGNGSIAIVRERLAIVSGTTPTGVRWVFDNPRASDPDAIYYAAARFIVRAIEGNYLLGRLGPFVSIRNGDLLINAILTGSAENEDQVGWLIEDGNLSGNIGNTGAVVLPVPKLDAEVFVELYVVGRDRVILFVNGQIVEDVPYSGFGANPTATTDVRIGVDGSGSIGAIATVTDGVARVSFGDLAFRALFLRRVAERLVFAGGLERNDRLDAWVRHQPGVFETRGTDRTITEIRRIAGDDEAELVIDRYPGSWYLGVTYPGITPTFISAEGTIPHVFAEYRANAPNFSADQLEKLFETYLLPRSVVEAQFSAALVTDLTDDSAPSGGNDAFPVEALTGFTVGDDVTLREVQSGTLLTLSYDGAPATAADTMEVSSLRGDVWAEWTTASSGTRGTELVGSVALGGKIADRLATVTAGGTVKARGASAPVDVWVEIMGREQGTGAAIVERLHVVGTGDVVGTRLWAQVHGVVCTPAAQDDVDVVDVTGAAVLYTIASGDRASGAYLFDPPLAAGPSTASIVADAATTDPIQLWGSPEGQQYKGENVALTGTSPVVTSTRWSTVRVVAAGYLATARTATIAAAFTDPIGPVQVVSNNAADHQIAVIFGVDTSGEPILAFATLNGTTPVSVPGITRPWHLLGFGIAAPAVGNVTLTQQGTVPVRVALIAPAGVSAGIDQRQIEISGEVTVQISAPPTGPRFVGVFGFDEDGERRLEIVPVLGGEAVTGSVAWSELRGVVSGGINSAVTITASGFAFRFPNAQAAIVGLASSYGWTVSGTTDLALDGVLSTRSAEDAIAAPVDLAGHWSLSEDTTILSLDPDTLTVETPTLSRTYHTGSRMRRKETAP